MGGALIHGAVCDVTPCVRRRTSSPTFDWNEPSAAPIRSRRACIKDETLRDGLQSPSVIDPCIADKVHLLRLMDDLGIDEATVGMPAIGPRAFQDALVLCREAVASKMKIKLALAGRTLASDIEPIVEISQRVGVELQVYTFIGSSPIRQYVEQWDVPFIAEQCAIAIDVAVRAGLLVTLVTEDTTRSRPETLATLFTTAIDHGARRLCLTDTVGHATPEGVRNLVQFTKETIAATGVSVELDWHGHNDRGLALTNALSALDSGVDCIHGTALGMGERVGNTPIELLLANLQLRSPADGDRDLTNLAEYCASAARAVGWALPDPGYPFLHSDERHHRRARSDVRPIEHAANADQPWRRWGT